MKLHETWLGIGVKAGGMLGVGGVESVSGTFYNLKNPRITHRFSMVSSRWGFGLGGGGGLVAIGVFKLNGLAWLDGRVMEDWGVNVDMGGKWAHLAKALEVKKFFRNVKLARVLGHIVVNLDEIRDAMHYIYNAYEFDAKGDHPSVSLDVPFAGAGLELSAFKTSGRMWIDD